MNLETYIYVGVLILLNSWYIYGAIKRIDKIESDFALLNSVLLPKLNTTYDKIGLLVDKVDEQINEHNKLVFEYSYLNKRICRLENLHHKDPK